MKNQILFILLIIFLLIPSVHAESYYFQQTVDLLDDNIVFQTINEPLGGWNNTRHGPIELTEYNNYTLYFQPIGTKGACQISLDNKTTDSIIMIYNITPTTQQQLFVIHFIPQFNITHMSISTLGTNPNIDHFNLTIYKGYFLQPLTHTDYETIYINNTITVNNTIYVDHTITNTITRYLSIFGDPNLWMPIFGILIAISAIIIHHGNKKTPKTPSNGNLFKDIFES